MKCGKVITTFNPFCMMTNRANKKDIISIYIDVEGEEYGN